VTASRATRRRSPDARETVHGEIRYDVSGEFVKTVWLCC
jgi:hypothetical protein